MHFITSLKTKIDTVIFNLHNKKYQTEIGKNVYLKNCECHNVSGQSNYIKIESNCILRNCIFRFDGSSNKVMIHSGSHLTNVTFWIEGDYNTIDLEKTLVSGPLQLAACEGTSIIIGKDCIFASDIFVRTTDSHSISNNEGQRINPAQSIKIGNHVWIGMQCLILKGSIIGNNSVVGARSMVTSSSCKEDHIVLAGSPAKAIKHNVYWSYSYT